MKVIKTLAPIAALIVLCALGTAFYKAGGQIPPATYTCGVSNITAAATPTDIVTLTGSPSGVIRVTRFELYATQTTGGAETVQLIRRASADTSGTFTQDGMNPYDTTDDVSDVTCGHYTGNPTINDSGKVLRNYRPLIPVSTSIPTGYIWEEFGDGVEPITLRGTSDILAVNLGGQTTTGLVYTVQIEWTYTPNQ